MTYKKFKSFLTILLIVILSLSLFSCSSTTANDTVKEFFESLKSGDVIKASTYMKGNSGDDSFKYEDANQEKMMKQLFSKINYEIISSSKEKNLTKVKVKVTTFDMASIMNDVLTEITSTTLSQALNGKEPSQADIEKAIVDLFVKKINEPNSKVITKEVEIKLTKDTDKKIWVIEPDDNLVKAITGNLEDAFEGLE